jgi:RNA polymerase sigma factor (sigma-70 family)
MNAPPSDEQDAQDMRRLASGDDSALDELMGRHAEKLFHYLVRSLQNEEDAADLAQETFVKVYQSRSRFDPSQKFSTWLHAIASNLVRNRYRWRSRHPQVSLDAESDQTGLSLRESVPGRGPSPREMAQIEEQEDAVRCAIAALPEDLRAPLILAEYEDLSQIEIGKILGCTTKAVETRIYRARQQLRSSLGKWLK